MEKRVDTLLMTEIKKAPNEKNANFIFNDEGDTLQTLIERAFKAHLKAGDYSTHKGGHAYE